MESNPVVDFYLSEFNIDLPPIVEPLVMLVPVSKDLEDQDLLSKG